MRWVKTYGPNIFVGLPSIYQHYQLKIGVPTSMEPLALTHHRHHRSCIASFKACSKRPSAAAFVPQGLAPMDANGWMVEQIDLPHEKREETWKNMGNYMDDIMMDPYRIFHSSKISRTIYLSFRVALTFSNCFWTSGMVEERSGRSGRSRKISSISNFARGWHKDNRIKINGHRIYTLYRSKVSSHPPCTWRLYWLHCGPHPQTYVW